MVEANHSAPANGVLRSNARANCTCQNCGCVYKPKAHDRVTYCSRKCSFEAKANKSKPEFSIYIASTCPTCGQGFGSRSALKVYCCEGCRPSELVSYVSLMPSSKLCRCCGIEYKPISNGGSPSPYCGKDCADSVKKACKRVHKAKRKAVLKCATVERVDPFKVFDRDKWKCQMCGVKTPKSKRGTYDDDAPELDHINPLAKGGDHSYLNTQCSCRKCNGMKSDTPMGQMLMFG